MCIRDRNGPNFYNLPINNEKIRLVSRSNEIPEFIEVIENNKVVGQIKPFHGGETLTWRVEGVVK